MATYTLASTQARKRFLGMVREAGASYARYIITNRGRPEAVIMGAEEFEGWLETLEIAQSDSWRKALAQASKQERAGRRLSFEEVTGKPQKKRRASR